MLQLVIIFVLTFSCLNSQATVPADIKKIINQEIPGAEFRIDDVVKADDKLWLLIKPKDSTLDSQEAITLVEKTDKKDFLFSNDWIYTPVENNSIKSLDYYPESLQNKILASRISQNLIVPKDFTLPRDLAALAGRLPLALSSVELASDRELLYQERMKEIKSQRGLEFLSYSFNDGKFNFIQIDQDTESKDQLATEIDKAQVYEMKNLSEAFSYVSSLKYMDNAIYLSDLPKSKIYKLTRHEEGADFDATKPLENEEVDISPGLLSDEVFDLHSIEHRLKIKDFIYNKNKSVLYLISSPENNLFVIDNKTKTLIKKIELPSMINSLKLVSRSASEPDQLVFISRTAGKLYIFSTFDYRISQTVDIKTLVSNKQLVLHDSFVSEKYILIATEAIDLNNKDVSKSQGKILYFDVITGEYYKNIDLSFVPHKLEASFDGKNIYALGMDHDDKAFLAKLDSKELNKFETLDLGVDIKYAKSMLVTADDKMLVIPSASTELIAFVDVETWTVIKKFDINSSSNFLLDLSLFN